jgi:hypothetical protein
MVQAGYTIADDYMDSFFDGWNFFTGRVPIEHVQAHR